MMLSFLTTIATLYTFDYGAMSYSLDCLETPYMCIETTIDCRDNEDCFIACNEEQSCMSSTINCPTNGDCNIECDGWQSCRNITINSEHSLSGNLNILCSDTTDHCNGIKIFGSTIETYSGNMNVLCNGAIQSCMNSYIQCPITGDCVISCNTDKSCKNSNIIGPNDGDLTINCNSQRACLGSTFNGTVSNHMQISGCIAMESCLDLSIYCPPNTNQNPNCFIQGNDNIGSIDIYAMNGWSDIQIDYSGDFTHIHGGIMHCGENNYDIQCHIASMNWKCDTDICDGIFNTTTTTTTNNETYDTVQTLPNLTNDFEHGSMGMVLIGGGLIAVAIACIFCGVVKHVFTKYKHKSITKKTHQKIQKEIHENRTVEAIIGGEEPSYEDSNGVIHHQHNYHERKLSSLHDKQRVKRI